jgi:hypothetical protein
MDSGDLLKAVKIFRPAARIGDLLTKAARKASSGIIDRGSRVVIDRGAAS